jgi:PilZ domain
MAETMSPSDGANRRRSERVMLQIPIVLMTESVDHEQLKEETHTLVVNAHGGLVKLEMEVLAGQPIVLTNPRSGAEVAARVVRIENPPGGYTAVAFEFLEPSPHFWPVEFPPADWTAARST